MNTESIDTTPAKFGQMEKPGDFTFDDEFEHIYLWLPGAKGPDALRIQKGGPGGDRVWGWDGNVDKPTLTPSIHDVGHWHGYLRAGRLVSC